MQNSKNIFFLAVLVFALPCLGSEEIVKGAVEGVKDVATSAANMESIMMVNAAMHAYPIAKDVFQYCFPTEEQQANNVVASERLAFVQARASFRKCLFSSNQNAERGRFNVPIKCESLTETFIQCGGKGEMVIMLRDFEDLRK